MRAYLPGAEVERRMRSISAFLEQQSTALGHAGGAIRGERGERDDHRIR
jgi:hypothetical protein